MGDNSAAVGDEFFCVHGSLGFLGLETQDLKVGDAGIVDWADRRTPAAAQLATVQGQTVVGVCPRPPAPSLPFARGFSPGGLFSPSSCSMRLISFSGGVGFIYEGWQCQASMAAAKACGCQTTKLWLSVQQY